MTHPRSSPRPFPPSSPAIEAPTATLSDIRAPRRGSKVRLIVLDDEPWRTTSADVVARLELEAGAEVDLADLAVRIGETELSCAREKAIRLLTYRERSAAGLRGRLMEDGYSETAAAAVTTDLERIGLIDDERFAHALARTLTQARGLGRGRVSHELARAGISEDLAAEVLEEALPPDAELDAARRLARVAAARPGATRDKVASRLLRRGYRPAVALAAARIELDDALTRESDDSGDSAEHVYPGGDPFMS
jgi:regulatory protein